MKRVNFSREDNVSRERKRRPRTPSLMKLLSHVEILSLSLSLLLPYKGKRWKVFEVSACQVFRVS